MRSRALLWWIALLTGFAGLLTQVVVARRAALFLGGTARAAAAVLASFLLALGLGSLWAARQPPSLVQAALRYAGVALLVPLAVVLWEQLAQPEPPTWSHGAVAAAAVLALCAGLPALLMGAAYPALFAHAPAAGLNAANLFGATAGAWLAGNQLLPELGYRHSAGIAALLELLAALLLWRAARVLPAPQAPPAPAPPVAASASSPLLVVALAGAATLAFEVLLLRRLPFFLEGFTPTLSAVLAAFLLALGLGSGAVAPLLARGLGRHALAVAAAAAALCIAATPLLLELLRPAPARAAGTSELLHLWSLFWPALVHGGPACLGLGAVVPLWLRRAPGEPRQLAARAFLALALGEACGALLLNHLVLPLCSSDPYRLGFAPAAACAALAAVLALGGRGPLRLLPLMTLAPLFLATPRPPLVGSRYLPEARLAQREIVAHQTDDTTTATVVWDKAEHQLLLYTDEFQAAATGRQSAYMRVLGLLPFLLGAGAERVAVLAIGTGTTAVTVHQCRPEAELHLVDVSRAVLAVQPEFAAVAGDLGEVLRAPRVALHLEDGRRFLATCAAASLDAITMEPLLPYAPGTVPLYTEEFYRLARARLRPTGWFVQWIPAHAMPAAFFRTLVQSFAQVFPAGSLWLLQNSVLLAGSPAGVLPERAALERAFAALQPAAGALQRAGVDHPDDLGVALVTTDLRLVAGDAPSLQDDRPWLERLGFWSGPMRDAFLDDNLALLVQAAERDQTRGDFGAGPWRTARLRRLLARRLAAGPRELRARTLVEAEAGLSAACRLLPDSLLLFRERALLRAPVLVERAQEAQALGRRAEAVALLERAIEDWPEWLLPWQRLAELERGHAGLQEQRALLEGSWRGLAPPQDAAALDQALVASDLTARWPAWLAVRPWLAAERLAQAFAGSPALAPAALARALAGRMDPGLLRGLAAWATRQPPAALATLLAATVAGRAALPVDWPLPPAFLAAARASEPRQRAALAEVGLAGRTDAVAIDLLLQLFLDPELPVRQAAAITLARSQAAPVALDPEAPPAQRADQAEQFRARRR